MSHRGDGRGIQVNFLSMIIACSEFLSPNKICKFTFTSLQFQSCERVVESFDQYDFSLDFMI